jgi:hypothetical protein
MRQKRKYCSCSIEDEQHNNLGGVAGCRNVTRTDKKKTALVTLCQGEVPIAVVSPLAWCGNLLS